MWYKLAFFLLLGITVLSIISQCFIKKIKPRLILGFVGGVCLICTIVLYRFPPTYASVYDAFRFMAHGKIIDIIDAPHSACIIYNTSSTDISYVIVPKVPTGYATRGLTIDVASAMSSNYGIMVLCDETKTDYFALGFYLTKTPTEFGVTDSLGSTFAYNKSLEKEPLSSYCTVDFYSYLSSYDSSYCITISNSPDTDVTIVPK